MINSFVNCFIFLAWEKQLLNFKSRQIQEIQFIIFQQGRIELYFKHTLFFINKAFITYSLCHKYILTHCPMINIISKKYCSFLLNSYQLIYGVSHKRTRTFTNPIVNSQSKKSALQIKKQKIFPNKQGEESEHIQESSMVKIRMRLKEDQVKIKCMGIDDLYDQDMMEETQTQDHYSTPWHNNLKQQKEQTQQYSDESQSKIQQIMSKYSLQKRINKFQRDLNIAQKIKNSKTFTQSLACFLNGNQQKQLVSLCKKYISQGGYIEGSKPSTKQKQLFKNVRKLLFKVIQDNECVNETISLFSKTDPKFIQIRNFKKVNDVPTNRFNLAYIPEEKKQLLDGYHEQFLKNFEDQTEKFSNKNHFNFDNIPKHHKVKNTQIFDIIQSLNQTDQISKRIRGGKLKIKKQTPQNLFKVDEQNMTKVQKTIFGNKKIITKNIMFQRVNNKTNQSMNNFGQNWVYCFDLSYDFNEQNAKQIIQHLEKHYGPICQFKIYPYKDMIQKNRNDYQFVIPQNFMDQSKKNRVKIEKIKNQQIMTQQLMFQSKPKQRKSLTTKILQKTHKQKQLKLNKSYMLFKFANKQDKNNFLIPQMRLFGCNIGKNFKNIKFEDAQAKKMIALSMIPQHCESQELVKFINNVLLPLRITITHPNCIITNSIFLQMANFYESYHANLFLNNQRFQNQYLKSQIIYGSSKIVQGEYKTNIQGNHYENLTQKLTQLRKFYSQSFS